MIPIPIEQTLYFQFIIFRLNKMYQTRSINPSSLKTLRYLFKSLLGYVFREELGFDTSIRLLINGIEHFSSSVDKAQIG